MQHATFQFALTNVSRQLLWSFLHAHPFYNSEQVSQRYVEVKPGNALIPPCPARELVLYRAAIDRQMESYHRLIELLTPTAEAEYFRLFPARRKTRRSGSRRSRRRRRRSPATCCRSPRFAHLYHTVSGLTLHRYHRLCAALDVPDEQRLLVDAMVPRSTTSTRSSSARSRTRCRSSRRPSTALLAELGSDPRAWAASGPGSFNAEFDDTLGAAALEAVDYKVNAEATLAEAVRAHARAVARASYLTPRRSGRVLSPAREPDLAESLTLTTLSKSTRALSPPALHVPQEALAHRRLAGPAPPHGAGSRPVLATQYAGGEPDAIVPDLIARTPEALERLPAQRCGRPSSAIDALLDGGVAPPLALYLLPNAFPIRFEESGDLLHLHHKWTSRLCYTAQEEIWRASLEEVRQVREVHPRASART